jgi:hypothetical protein
MISDFVIGFLEFPLVLDMVHSFFLKRQLGNGRPFVFLMQQFLRFFPRLQEQGTVQPIFGLSRTNGIGAQIDLQNPSRLGSDSSFQIRCRAFPTGAEHLASDGRQIIDERPRSQG